MLKNNKSENSEDRCFSKTILTFLCFCVLCAASPFLLINYCVLQCARRLWIALLANRFPQLEFIKTHSVRSLVDSWRNPAVINVLMEIRGTCDKNRIRQAVTEHLLERRDKVSGQLCHAHLRRRLVSCWGSCAWGDDSEFDINKHVVCVARMFRGRAVSEANIQEYVSGITKKYLPSNQPPWQIVIVPNIVSLEEKYYVIVRLHHLLLAKEYRINIGDFLLLKPRAQTARSIPFQENLASSSQIQRGLMPIPAQTLSPHTDPRYKPQYPHQEITFHQTLPRRMQTQQRPNVYASQKQFDEQSSPLLNIFENPTAVPELWQRLGMSLTNFWNEFIGAYDPLETPNKKPVGILHMFAIIVIILVSVWKDLTRGGLSPRATWIFKSRYVKASLDKEFTRRNVTWSSVFHALLITVHPIHFVIYYFRFWFNVFAWICKIPLRMFEEFMAVSSIMLRGYCTYPSTVTALLHDYVPLLYRTLRELCYVFAVVYNAPIRIFSDIFLTSGTKHHNLQTVSLCGRKVVAWSSSVKMETIRGISEKTGVTTSEVALSAACGALSDYFRENELPMPSQVNATVRHVRQDFLLTPFSPNKTSHRDRIGGVICISLPLEHSDSPDVCLQNLDLVKSSLARSRERQKALYGLSLIQTRYGTVTRALPGVLSKLCANYLSRKYAVTVTEVAPQADGGDSGMMETRWGDEVTGVMYWRPPQANISVSITFQVYGSYMRMGVMADAQLSPHHTTLATGWSARISDLARATGVNDDIVLKVPTILINQEASGAQEDEQEERRDVEDIGRDLDAPGASREITPQGVTASAGAALGADESQFRTQEMNLEET